MAKTEHTPISAVAGSNRASGFDEVVRDGFERAARATGASSVGYTLAGQEVRIRLAPIKPEVDPIRAFAHLLSPESGKPALTIQIWDSASTGLEPPPCPPESNGVSNVAGALYYYEESGFQMAYQTGPGALSVLDAHAGAAWYWVRDFKELPYWDRASPIRHILHWWLGGQGCLQVHGGAVGDGSGGALLVGKGGSGKSTSTLACLGSELKFAGDDYVAITLSGQPGVYSLYNSGKLDPQHVDRFPHLRAMLANGDRLGFEKAVLYVDGGLRGATIAEFPLRAILLPTITGNPRPSIVPASRAEALSALAPSTIFQLHPPRQDALATMARLVSQVPAFVLELGPDIPAIPRRIAQLLRELGDGQGA